jgi:hypothetical protein
VSVGGWKSDRASVPRGSEILRLHPMAMRRKGGSGAIFPWVHHPPFVSRSSFLARIGFSASWNAASAGLPGPLHHIMKADLVRSAAWKRHACHRQQGHPPAIRADADVLSRRNAPNLIIAEITFRLRAACRREIAFSQIRSFGPMEEVDQIPHIGSGTELQDQIAGRVVPDLHGVQIDDGVGVRLGVIIREQLEKSFGWFIGRADGGRRFFPSWSPWRREPGFRWVRWSRPRRP